MSRILGVLITGAWLGLGGAAGAAVHYVDTGVADGAGDGASWADAYASLSAALSAAAPGDELWVAQGTYTPAPPGATATNRFNIRSGLQLYGGFASGMSSPGQRDPYRHVTILCGDLNGNDTPGFGNRGDNVANVVHVLGANGVVIDGFTIRGGYGSNSGAGLYLAHTSGFIVSRCTFTDNYIVATGAGAGMWCDLGAIGTVRQCLFDGNYSGFRGGGFGMDGYLPPYASVTMVNCTVFGNEAAGEGDGVYARADQVSVFTIRNSIIWLNGVQGAEPQNIRERGNATVNISYSNYDRQLSSGDGITDYGGQLTTDPLFADERAGDFHLKSEAGRWTPAGVVFDDVTSPCVDAGDPADPCDDEPQFGACRIDMGAYGGTPHAAGSRGRVPGTGFHFFVR